MARPSPSAPRTARLSAGAWVIILALALLLAVSIWMAVDVWNTTDAATQARPDGGGDVSGHGIAALILGGIGSIVVGGGLMALVFFSNRSGHDQAVHEEARQRDPDET